MAAPSRRLCHCQTLADPVYSGSALSARRQGPALEELAKSREEREPMFIRKGDQLVPKLFRFGRLPCRKRRQANDKKRVCEGMGVAELPGAPERLVHRLASLIGVAPMPERQC